MTKKNRQRFIKVFAILAIIGMVASLLGGSLLYLFI